MLCPCCNNYCVFGPIVNTVRSYKDYILHSYKDVYFIIETKDNKFDNMSIVHSGDIIAMKIYRNTFNPEANNLKVNTECFFYKIDYDSPMITDSIVTYFNCNLNNKCYPKNEEDQKDIINYEKFLDIHNIMVM